MRGIGSDLFISLPGPGPFLKKPFFFFKDMLIRSNSFEMRC